MLKVVGSVTIHRSAKDVFAYVSEPENQSDWQPGLHEVSHKPGATRGTGSTTEVRKVMGRRVEHTMEIVDFQEDKKISHRGAASSHDGAMERHISLQEIGNGSTRVTLEMDIDTKGALKAAAPVLQRMVQREVDSDLLHLKDILEAHDDLHQGMKQLRKHGAHAAGRA